MNRRKKRSRQNVNKELASKKGTVSFVIDGQPITVERGTSILEAAQQLNIDIPTLCYHKALSAYGACRLCVVEIEKDGWKKILTSCTYIAEDGIVVRTNTEELQNIRRTMIQLIMARAPHAKKVQEMARTLGVASTPFVERDDDCIRCGLCIRMCRERMGRDIITFMQRGDKREIAPAFDVASD